MAIQPTISFTFSPTCKSFRCLCCEGSDEDDHYVPTKDGVFKSVGLMNDAEVEKANIRFKEIILRKIDPLPLDNDEFLKILEEEGISLHVSRENPLTKSRLEDTIKKINEILGKMKIN